jgi:ketosteroid isomerase-like protein
MEGGLSMDDMATMTGAEADVKEIQAWIERYCATVTAGDFDGYRDFWTEDVVWLFRPDARSSRDAAVLANTAASQ